MIVNKALDFVYDAQVSSNFATFRQSELLLTLAVSFLL